MKDLNITSFLMAIALSFFNIGQSIAQNSIDCQSKVNFSLGERCTASIPFEAFNSWEPSCLVISQDGMKMAVIASNGSFSNGQVDCFMEIDSVWVDTISKKTDIIIAHRIPAWSISCDGMTPPDTLYADLSEVTNLCNPDTLFSAIIGGSGIQLVSGTVVVNTVSPPTCSGLTLASDGELIFTDTVITYEYEQHVKTVVRVDTFSHSDPLRWVKGTLIMNVNGVDSIIHGITPVEGKIITSTCAPASLDDLLGGTVFGGPNVLLPGSYKYSSYSSDRLNSCWGEINLEYKYWPDIGSRKDTLSCLDLITFDRTPAKGSIDYTTNLTNNLDDVCEWAENIYTGSSTRQVPTDVEPGIGALRTSNRIEWLVNTESQHCYTHSISTEDRFINNFDWICDNVYKERSFLAEKSGHGLTVLLKDTLVIRPLTIEEIQFPDSVIYLKCGIITDESPEEIAEYLYKALDYFGDENSTVITGASNIDPSGYTKEKPCDVFAEQYANYDVELSSNSTVTKHELWKKVFSSADFNNYGVRQAFPYGIRKVKLTDQGLKDKLSPLELSNDLDIAASFEFTVDSLLIPINQIICNIAATKHDLHPVTLCGGERKIFRQWTLIDWCNGSTREATQVIKLVDDEAPSVLTLDGLDKDEYFGNNNKVKIATGDSVRVKNERIRNPWGCTIAYTFPELELKEYCSTGLYHYKLLDKNLVSDGKIYQAGEVVNVAWDNSLGFTTPIVKIELSDECDNENAYYFYLKAQDLIPPVVVLHNNVIVTLTVDKSIEDNSTGIAKVFCEDVDAGSHDGDCGDIKTCSIRIKGTTEWLDGVHFECNDLGQHTVEFRAEDQSGNTSIGWTTVTVENKLAPIIFCENRTIGCTDSYDADLLGYPYVTGVCAVTELEYEDEYEVDELCFKGKITRTWSVKGSDPKVQCTQIITINEVVDGEDGTAFNPSSIRWPLHHTGQSLKNAVSSTDRIVIKDVDTHDICREFEYDDYEDFRQLTDPNYDIDEEILEKCEMNDFYICEFGETEEPSWTDPDCGLIGVTFDDQILAFNETACFKILRNWAVIDWCTYNPGKGDQYNENIVFVKDKCDGSMYFSSRKQENQGYDGYYAFVQEFKIHDETPPQVMVRDTTFDIAESIPGENECERTVTLNASATDVCGENMTSIFSGTNVSFRWQVIITEVDAEGKPVGNSITESDIIATSNEGESNAQYTLTGKVGQRYRLLWSVNDGCNNRGEGIQFVEFFDVKAPIIKCLGSLSTNIMSNNGTAVIWATDYAEASDCNGAETDVWFKDSDGAYSSSYTITCDDLNGLYARTFLLFVYSADESGNESFCEVMFRATDSNQACGVPGAALISGGVRTLNGDMVESAEVALAEKTAMTNVDGRFAFENLLLGNSYSISAKKKDDYLNGVSTLDLVLIQRHILGIQQLDSPYKIIAADINSDENVSALDMVELRKLILGVTSELKNNSSWRFTDASIPFVDDQNPFPFVEAIYVDNLIESRTNDDLMAIKIGDVTGDVIANSLIASSRSNQIMTLVTDDSELKSGEIIELPIRSNETSDLVALQFTLNLSGLEYMDINPGLMDIEQSDLAVLEDRITVAWSNTEAIHGDNDVLFTLVFRATQNSSLSNAISIGSAITSAMAYDQNYQEQELALRFNTVNGAVEGATFELHQNKPNPFEDITTIGFQLVEAGAAKVTVFDVTGKIVTLKQGTYSRGYNEMTISKADLQTSGVLYYQLESGDFTATRKMILID